MSGEIPLIPGTLEENLLYGSGASIEDAKKYSELLPDIVFTKPDLKVGLYESGITSGEARKIALVRALLYKCDMLILDEVFVNTDNSDIEMFLKLIPTGKTCLIISRSTIVEKFADRILTLEGGRIST
jgi:ABC-type multidrug transport system fused ATPase/permease subunit